MIPRRNVTALDAGRAVMVSRQKPENVVKHALRVTTTGVADVLKINDRSAGSIFEDVHF